MPCPLLEILSIRSRQRKEQRLSWTIRQHEEKYERQPQQQQEQQQLGSLLRLRSLTLRNVAFAQASLENLLTLTPDLKVLKLMDMNWNPTLGYNWVKLFNHLKDLKITLDAVDFSTYRQQSSWAAMSRLSEICPSTSDWTLWAPNITPSFLQTLTLRTSVVTTLELYWRSEYNRRYELCCQGDLKDTPRLVHEYLCTSSQLVYLKALKIPFQPYLMDLFSRGNPAAYPKCQKLTSPSTTLWVCRGLERLHIEVHGTFVSRILFGYISRVLPKLEELYITRPGVCESISGSMFRPTIDLQLKGGLCLLSRLRHLERLWVQGDAHQVTQRCGRMDLSWIEHSRDNATLKALRQQEIEQWNTPRFMEYINESTRLPPSPPILTRESDAEIWNQLQNLGLFQDVVEMIHEMDSKGFRPLPSLMKLSFESPFLQPPDVELNTLCPARKVVSWSCSK